MFVLLPVGGGLGNLLLQHHFIYALARKHGLPVCISVSYHDPKRPHIIQYRHLFQHVQFVAVGQQHSGAHLEEPCFRFTPPDLPTHSNEIVTLRGYFQSYKYFDGYAKEIRDLLRGNVLTEWERISAKFAGLGATHVTCVHVRRGDYLGLPNYHTILGEDYYEQALSLLPRNTLLLVFAEDVAEIRGWRVWQNTRVKFVEDEPDPVPTLFLMSLCHAFVLANSSLSLNAYYMREHDTALCIAPQKWFGPDGPTFDIFDIVPPGTRVLDT
jgi:hypothetical protein